MYLQLPECWVVENGRLILRTVLLIFEVTLIMMLGDARQLWFIALERLEYGGSTERSIRRK